MSIPKRLIRTAPDVTDDEQDRLWRIACDRHPGWMKVDIRNSVDPGGFPLTAPYWPDCESGAQQADLKRFEELWWRGGIYIDSDVECLRPFDALLGLPAFAGYEDRNHVCIAILGFQAGHPALKTTIELAIQRRHQGTWKAGMGAFNDVVRGRDDVVLFPPAMLYPWNWHEPEPDGWREKNPWAWCCHYWAKSWREKVDA